MKRKKIGHAPSLKEQKSDMPSFIIDKFYGIEFVTGGNPIDGPTTEWKVVCYIGELNNRHLFDSLGIVVVLGPNDIVVNGPSDSPFGTLRKKYKKG